MTTILRKATQTLTQDNLVHVPKTIQVGRATMEMDKQFTQVLMVVNTTTTVMATKYMFQNADN